MDKQREDFEAWVREYGNYPRRPELKTSDGAYHYLHTESEWRAWQAAQLAAAQGQVPQAWTNVLAYALQDDLHNRLTPRVIDIAYSAFMQAKQPNKEDGGASDWFNDTKPMVNELIAKLRKDLVEEFGDATIPQPPAPCDAAREYMTGYSDGREWAAAQLAAAQGREPVDAVPLSDMVEGSHPRYGRGLFATDNCVKQFYAAPIPQAAAQPSAPSDTTITYMTGYSDGKEWAQPSQAVELDYEKKLDIVSNWFSDEGMQSRAMQMLGDIEQAIAAAHGIKQGGQHD